MWGDETQAGPEEQGPRDRSKGRMRHVTKYPLLEDCVKTKQSEWSSVTFWSWPCVPGEASRLLLLCEESGPILLDRSLSANGTSRTCRDVRSWAASGGQADINRRHPRRSNL